jgi:hypothetical protein
MPPLRPVRIRLRHPRAARPAAAGRLPCALRRRRRRHPPCRARHARRLVQPPLTSVRAPEGPFVVVNCARAVLGRTASGHVSPLAARRSATDSVLVLDVARFEIPPCWLHTVQLRRAMTEDDPANPAPCCWLVLSLARRPPRQAADAVALAERHAQLQTASSGPERSWACHAAPPAPRGRDGPDLHRARCRGLPL